MLYTSKSELLPDYSMYSDQRWRKTGPPHPVWFITSISVVLIRAGLCSLHEHDARGWDARVEEICICMLECIFAKPFYLLGVAARNCSLRGHHHNLCAMTHKCLHFYTLDTRSSLSSAKLSMHLRPAFASFWRCVMRKISAWKGLRGC